MAKIQPTLNHADLDLLAKKFATKQDLKSFATKQDLKGLAKESDFQILKRWMSQTFATKQELSDTEERLTHEIGNYKDSSISDYKRLEENQAAIEGRVFDQESRLEKLEKSLPVAEQAYS